MSLVSVGADLRNRTARLMARGMAQAAVSSNSKDANKVRRRRKEMEEFMMNLMFLSLFMWIDVVFDSCVVLRFGNKKL